MKLDEKKYSIIMTVLNIITGLLVLLNFLNYGNKDIIFLLLGFIQIFTGLNEINLSKQTDSNGKKKGNKIFGIVLLGIGFVVLLIFTYELINF